MSPHSHNIIRVISLIDVRMQYQLNLILHHTVFQSLEARWRALHFMITTITAPSPTLCVRLLCFSEHELQTDLYNASDFDQSVLFRKIYTDEYDQPGGKPFGLLITDYTLELDAQGLWLRCLKVLADIAAVAFTPVLISAAAQLFGLDNFTQLGPNVDLADCLMSARYDDWHALRHDESLRFIYAVLPRVLWREPYQKSDFFLRNHGFNEVLESLDDYLWGSPAYIVGIMVIQSYMQTKWFMSFREQALFLAPLYYAIDTQKLMPLSRLEGSFTENMEYELAQQGFMTVIESPYQYLLQLRSSYSLYLPTASASSQHLSNMASTTLPYLLSVCRFTHYLKMIARDKIGGFSSASDIEQCLKKWIFHYCGKAGQHTADHLVRYPLEKADIAVSDDTRRPGFYFCKFALKPNYYVESIVTRLQFVLDMRGRR